MPPLVLGVAGGSGSGKTTVARTILNRVGADHIAYVPHDAYYRDFADLPHNAAGQVNWDHPDALDTDLMIAHLQALRAGQAVELPIYDFTHHRRTTAATPVAPQPIILVEGILLFADPRLRTLFDVKIFVDTDPDIRLIRRLERDITERGRTALSVIQQYLDSVRPMHLEFVEPSKRWADLIVPTGVENKRALEMLTHHVLGRLKREPVH